MAINFSETNVGNPGGAQGSYPLNLDAGHEGMIADLQAFVSRSYTNESGVVIPYGHAVVLNGAAKSGLGAMLAIGAANKTILGITTDSNVFENSAGSTYSATPATKTADGRIGYANKQMVNVLSKGVIYVYTDDAVNPALDVRLFHSDSAKVAGGYSGRFTVAAEAGKTWKVTSGARWLSLTTGAGLALLEIDIPTLAVTADT